jgi:UDP-N-acetylglucosamine transferase subunit ALG13
VDPPAGHTTATGSATGVPRPVPGVRIPRQRRAETTRVVVLVVVGTDKHPFDRLLNWLERWYADAVDQVDMLVQYGQSRPPTIPGAVPFLGHAELQAAMSRAGLVVCHGGPATILEARRHGHRPLVVPRDPGHGEHVDDHQQLFARRLAAAGMVEICETRDALAAALRAGVAEPQAYAVAMDQDLHEARLAAVARVGRIVDDLVVAARTRATSARGLRGRATRRHR